MYKFRLVYPYESDKIYNKTKIKNAADECYNELKQSNNNNYNYFCVMNIDKNHIYNFEIKKKTKNKINQNDNTNNTLNTEQIKNKIKYFESNLNKFKDKLNKKNNPIIYNNTQMFDISELQDLNISKNHKTKSENECKIM